MLMALPGLCRTSLMFKDRPSLLCVYDRAVICLWHCQGCIELV